LISTGRDGFVRLHDAQFKSSRELMSTGGVATRAISVDGHSLIVSCEDSGIWYLRNYLDEKCTPESIVKGHSSIKETEIWGLAPHPTEDVCVTVSEDGNVILWDLVAGTMKHRTVLPEPLGCGEYSSDGAYIVVSAMNHRAFVLNSSDLGIVFQLEGKATTKDGLKPIKMSPNSKYIAIGGFSAEASLDIYDFKEKKLVGTCTGHASHVAYFDWSMDSNYIQSNSVDHELLFWEIPSCKQQTFASELKDVKWASMDLTTAWPTIGVWKEGMNGGDIHSVARNKAQTLLLSGSTFGIVGLFNYPCATDNVPSKDYQGHSSQVTKVAFSASGNYALSIGGLDGTLIQWKINF